LGFAVTLADIEIKASYAPGMGVPIGLVVRVDGESIIIHENELHGFFAKKHIKLYIGDTLFTQDKSGMSILLNDRSRIVLGASTNLSLDRLLFDPVHGQRAAFMMLSKGKARFHVQKFQHFKQKSFNVKTKTSLIGVYGSDFIIQTTLKRTEVSTLSDTVLSMISLIAPYASPVLLHDYMWGAVNHGELPSDVEKIGIEVIEVLKRELPIEKEHMGFFNPQLKTHQSHFKKEQHKHQSSRHQMDRKMPSFTTDSSPNEQKQSNPTKINNKKYKEKVFALSSEKRYSIYDKQTKDESKENQDHEFHPYIRMRKDVLIDPEDISRDLINPVSSFKTIESNIYSTIDEDTDDQKRIIEAEQTDSMSLPWFPKRPDD
jgi:hypothetical protein